MDLPGLDPDRTCDGQNRDAGDAEAAGGVRPQGDDGAADRAAPAQLGHPDGRPPAAREDLPAAAHVPARARADRPRRARRGEPADRHPGGRDPEGVQAGAGRRDQRARGDARDDRERGPRHPAGGAGRRRARRNLDADIDAMPDPDLRPRRPSASKSADAQGRAVRRRPPRVPRRRPPRADDPGGSRTAGRSSFASPCAAAR